MKKILIATTILAASAGAAAAEGHIKWGASAAAGIAQNGTSDGGLADPNTSAIADDALSTYSTMEVSLTASGQTDGGLEFGASFSASVGTSYALADDDGFANEGGFDPMPSIFVSGSFGKITFADDDFDFFDDTNAGGDAKYEGTFGGFSVGVIADVDSNNASAKVGYTMGAVALSANIDTYEIWNVEATYTMGAIAVTAATDESNNSSVKVAYTGGNGISGSAQYNTSDESVDITAGYSANGLSVSAETNTVSNAWTVTGSYDLGGGLSVEAGTNYTQDMMLGAKMAF